MENRTVNPPWSDLPKELVEKIGQCLDTHIDVLRFRAVCTTWRSSCPPTCKNSPPLPLKVPLPIDPHPYAGNPDFYLIETIVYLFQPNDNTCRGWLVKVIKTVDGKSRILNPITDDQIEYFPDNMPKVLNLLDFRVSQVCKCYHVQYVSSSDPLDLDLDYDAGHNGRKFFLSTNLNHWIIDFNIGNIGKKFLLSTNHANDFSLMGIDNRDQLCYLKSGDDKWTMLKGDSRNIMDIIEYKGNFHVVDRYGETIMFDSSLIETKVASSLCDGGSKKRLVESCGQLFLVDMFLDVDFKKGTPHRGLSWLNVLEIKMYRLDEEQHEWIEVQTLGDRIFFAGDDCCFSVSAQDFGDCKGNCIYYGNGLIRLDILGENSYDNSSDDDKNEHSSKSACGLSEELVHRYKGLHGHNTGIFTIKEGKLGSLLSFLEYADIFWPPPSWLNI